ncbi:MAG: carbohydrate ABC transporter substrate-binding protein [Clostridiales bacterium]|nr:carbohydrate ABC transporter substrate-binding protein [Clostridiales bacterium]
MKRNLKIILISTILASNTALLSACSSSLSANIESNNEKGGYLETEIELPKDLAFANNLFYKDNKVNVIGTTNNNEYKNFILQEDNTFLQQDLPKGLKMVLENNNLVDIGYIDENSCVVLVMNYETGKTMLNIIQNESVKNVELDNANYSDLFINNNEIFLFSVGEKSALNRYDLECNLLKSYNIGIGNYIVKDNEIIVLDIKETSLTIYDLETGDIKSNVSKPDLDYSDILSVDDKGNIYICGKNGIEKFLRDSGSFEKIIDGNSTYLGMPTSFVNDVIAINEKEYYSLFYDSSSGDKIIKYTYDENANKNFKAELNVYMLQDNPFIKQAIFNYKKDNPDININIQVGYDEHNGITKEDAIKNLNTEILSGKSADIIILDGLNVDNYIEKGVLLDISDVIMPLVGSNEILENIVNPFIKDGKIYTIPTRFAPSTIWGNSEIINNYTGLDSLAKWQQENPDKMMFYPMKPEKLIEKTFKTNTQILNEDDTINEDELKKYLENIKILSSDKDTGAKMETELEENIGALEYLAYKDIQVHIQEMMTAETEFNHSYASMKMNGNATYKVNDGYFKPLNMIGINSKSKNIDIAKDIIKTALSQETQKINIISDGGITVNKKVFDSFKVIEDNKDENISAVFMMIGVHPDKNIDMGGNLPSDEDKVKFYETIEKVSKPTKEDTILMNFIIEESKGYFKGEMDIEKTTKAILQKANTYLSE